MSERIHLPYIDLLNFIGLNTKSSNEIKNDLSVSVSTNTDLFQVYGAVSKPYGSSRFLASIYTENGSPAAIPWVGFFKFTELNGQIARHVLANAGSFLYRVETDGTLTRLTGTGKNVTETWINPLAHMSQKSDAEFLFITNQNPQLIGNGNTLVKYDGNEITRWGLLRPGDEPNVTKVFDSVGSAPPTGPNSSWIPTNGTAASNTVTTRDGFSILLTKTSVASTECYIEETIPTALICNNSDRTPAQVFVYIPKGELVKLANSNAVVIKMTSDSQLSSGITIPNFTTNNYTWTFKIGELFEGWNQLQLGFSTTSTDVSFDSHLVITGAPTITALNGIRVGFNSVGVSTTPAGIGFSKLQSFTRGNVTSADGAAGSVFSSGAIYTYKVTFVNKQGFESNASAESATQTTAQALDTILVTNIPVSADPQVVRRKLYRTVNGGSLWVFVDSIDDNTTTTFTDTIADEALGSLTAPEAGDVSSDNSPPPQVGIIKFWKHTMFGAGDPENPTTLFWSNSDSAEGWPTLNTASLDARITAIYESYSSLIVETELGKWQVSGDAPDFRTDKIINNIGCVGPRAAGETRVDGWAIDRDGMRLYDANNPVKISEPIRDKFDNFNKEFIEVTHSISSKNNNCILMCVPNLSTTDFTNDNYIYQYPVDETGQGWWWKLEVPVSVLHLAEIEDENGDFHVLFGSTDGMIYELFDFDSKNWALADGTTEPIETTITTKWLRLGQLGENVEQVTGRVAPRFIELIADGDPCTWTMTIDTATGPVQSAATSTTDVPIVFGDNNEKLMRYPIKSELQPGEYVRVTAFQGDTDVRSRILAMRLYFHVQPFTGAIESGAFNADIDGIGEG